MMRFSFIGIGLCLCLLSGCASKGPQRPSHRSGETPKADSAQLALMELNQQMAKAADEQLTRLAQEQKETYALYEHNVWVHVLEAGDRDGNSPRQDEEWDIRLRTYSLSGRLYRDEERKVRIGRYELPAAIEDNIAEWHHGTHVRLLVPWYAAYGIQGTAEIPPYENVIMDLELR